MLQQIQPLTADGVWALLPARRPGQATNKGSYGAVLAAAGSLAYRGAASLACEGALRTGAGLVYLLAPEPVIALALARTPECCALPCAAAPQGCAQPQQAAALAAGVLGRRPVLLGGPGLGPGAGALLSALLAPPLAGRWAGLVLDADGLNALAGASLAPALLPPHTILTPHPGEMARLLNIPVAQVQADRPAAARACAETFGCVAVLKGSGTLIAAPGGPLWRCDTGNPGLARGGSGDVLAGMVAALLAQGLSPQAAACCGVYLHGAAADACARRRSMQCMLPHDLLDDLGALFARHEQEPADRRNAAPIKSEGPEKE